MDAFEIIVKSKYKQLETDIQDIIMAQDTKISNYADVTCSENYNLIVKVSKEYLEALGKICNTKNPEIATEDYNAWKTCMDTFTASADEVTDFFMYISKFYMEVLNQISPLTEDKIQEINTLITGTTYYNCQKLSNILRYYKNKLIDNIKYLTKEMVYETWKTYKQLVFDTIQDTINKSEILYEDLFKRIDKNDSEKALISNLQQNKLKKLMKILDRRTLDKLLTDNGFEPNRQNGTSHMIYSNGIDSIPVPIHGKDMDKNLAFTIQRELRQINKRIS